MTSLAEQALQSPDRVSRRASLALWPFDRFAGGTVRQTLRVFLLGRPERAIRNPSGFYVFTGLAPGSYALRVEAVDALAPAFLPLERSVTLTAPDDLAYVRADLEPAPAYPFPAHAMLARGETVTPEGPAAGVRVRVSGLSLSLETRSDAAGQLVFFARPPGPIDVDVELERGGVVRHRALQLRESATANLGSVSFPA